jgi:uncharacterized protein (TIGR02679 family)
MAQRVTGLATDPQLAPLWKAVHDRLSKGGVAESSIITVRDTAPETRRAVDRLLGHVSTGAQLKVHYGKLEAALGRAGTTTRAVVEVANGPITDRSAARADATAATEAVWERIGAHPAAADPALAGWLATIRKQGRLVRSGGDDALCRALDVLAVLPWGGPVVGRPVLAAGIVGDEHGLDDSTHAGRLVLAGLAARAGASVPGDATGRAALWAGAGVSLDAVSAPVLTLGLRPHPVGPITEASVRWADSGVPLPVPVGAVTRERWAIPAGTVVWVVENPSVLEAAASRFGRSSPPVVCVAGMPSRAAHLLFASLTVGGARLRYHGDFGAGGITIANLIVTRHGAEPWRMGAADHQYAITELAARGRTPNPLCGQVPAAVWDPELAGAIVAYGREVTEEHVLETLLGELDDAQRT